MVFSSFWEPSIITSPTSQGIGGLRSKGVWTMEEKMFPTKFREKSPKMLRIRTPNLLFISLTRGKFAHIRYYALNIYIYIYIYIYIFKFIK